MFSLLKNNNKIVLMRELKDKSYYDDLINDFILDGCSLSEVNKVINVRDTINENHSWSIPRMVKIPKDNGKTRDIFVFEDYDSILLKVINKILVSKLGHLVSDNVYSYKKGVSSGGSCKVIRDYLNENLSNNSDKITYVKADISKYFNLVRQDIIFKELENLIEDEQGLLLMKRLFSIDCYSYEGEVIHSKLGLMPGTATSTFLSNYLLRDLDKTMSEKYKFYARYSDDILVICDNDWVEGCLYTLRGLINDYGLKLNDDKTYIGKDVHSITFLGLEVTKNYVDMSNSNFVKIKKEVKSICNSYRKLYELDSKSSKVDVISYCLKARKEIDSYFYNGYLMNNTRHRNSKLCYVFGSIATDRTLKLLDCYVRDSLRYVATGKNNKGNLVKYGQRFLDDLYYCSTVEMYNIFKMSKACFIHKSNEIISYNNKLSDLPKAKLLGLVDNLEPKNLNWELGLLELIKLLKSSKANLVIDGFITNFNSMRVSKDFMSIYLNGEKIVDSSKILIDSVKVLLYGDLVDIKLSNKVLSCDLVEIGDLLETYRSTFVCFKNKKKVFKHNYFNKISHKDLFMSGFDYYESKDDEDVFMTMFYCFINQYSTPRKFNLEKDYCIIGSKLPLVFETKLIKNTFKKSKNSIDYV